MGPNLSIGRETEHGKPLSSLEWGKHSAREADEDEGKRGWSKQMPSGNKEDRGNSSRENGQTSIWCLITRNL